MIKDQQERTLIMTLELDLTANNVNKINGELDSLMPAPGDFDIFELNLRNTENIDSVGVTFVIGLYKRIKGMQKTFCIAGASSDVQSLFKLMKLDQFFEMRGI